MKFLRTLNSKFTIRNSKFLLGLLNSKSQIRNSKFPLILLAHRKKSAKGDLRLTGMPAVACTFLTPEGVVLVNGELWRARSADAQLLPPDSTLNIVGAAGHLLLVEARSPISSQ